MADVTLPALDASSTVINRTFLAEDVAGGGKKHTAYVVEHPGQRDALIAALSPLAQIATLLTAEGGYVDGIEGLLAAVRDKLIAAPATEATVAAVLSKLPVAPATAAGQASQLAALIGSAYADVSVASLSAGQAAATATILAANPARKTLMINPPSDCVLRITSGAGGGYPLFGGVPNTLSGQECPTNALYVTGLAASVSVIVWEG